MFRVVAAGTPFNFVQKLSGTFKLVFYFFDEFLLFWDLAHRFWSFEHFFALRAVILRAQSGEFTFTENLALADIRVLFIFIEKVYLSKLKFCLSWLWIRVYRFYKLSLSWAISFRERRKKWFTCENTWLLYTEDLLKSIIWDKFFRTLSGFSVGSFFESFAVL